MSTPPTPPPQPSMLPHELDIFFRKFNDYPWLRDRPFLQALLPTLGPLTTPFSRPTALSLTLQARIWWFTTRFNTTIDRALYETWSQTHPSQIDAQLLDKVSDIQRQLKPSSASSDEQLPAWMTAAPQKVDLGIKADDGEVRDGTENAGTGEDAPYPVHFQGIVEAVMSGKPLEGVREIPNTVVRKEGITAVGKMQAPRKPWERQRTEIEVVEKEFPPVGEDGQTAGP